MDKPLTLPPKFYELDSFRFAIHDNFVNIERFIKDDSITNDMLADDAVDTAQIAADAVDAAAVNATEVPTLAADNSFTGDNTLDGFINLGTPESLTIATGAVTATKSFIEVDTESAAASDDLDTINGGSNGDLLFLRIANASRVVTLKHNTGNIQIADGADRVINAVRDQALFLKQAGNWREVNG